MENRSTKKKKMWMNEDYPVYVLFGKANYLASELRPYFINSETLYDKGCFGNFDLYIAENDCDMPNESDENIFIVDREHCCDPYSSFIWINIETLEQIPKQSTYRYRTAITINTTNYTKNIIL